MAEKKDKDGSGEGSFGLGGFLRGLADVVEKLGELAEKGQDISKTGEIRGPTKELKGIYGFNVKFGLGGEGIKVEPFGNIGKDKTTGRSVVQEIREPVVDVFEEEDHILVVAEMPGVTEEDVRLDVRDDVLTIDAERGDKKYRKEVLLPGSFAKEKMAVSCNNGILEIKCLR
jgi:HSP20 family protein